LSVKLAVALRMLGFRPEDRVQFDHDPALALRPWDEEKQDFIPPQLDPEYIVIRTEPAHDKKTNGNGATSFGSDKHAIAKVGALEGIRHHEGRCVLYDGMDGQYVAIGRVIEKTGNHDHFEHPIRIAPLSDAERQCFTMISAA
jgi:hypothetical protein